MKTFSQTEILNRYEKLPQAVKDSIFAEATAERMESIGRKHGLLLDAIGDLATETGYVMVGLVHPQEFPGRLTSVLAIPAVKASAIAEDVSNEVFKPIREHMLKTFNIIKDEKPSFVPQNKVSDIKTPSPASILPPAPPPPKPVASAPTPVASPPPAPPPPPQAPSFVPPPPQEKIAPMIFPDKSKLPNAAPPAPSKEQFTVPKSPPTNPTPSQPAKPINPVFGDPSKMNVPVAPSIPPSPTPSQSAKSDPYHEPI